MNNVKMYREIIKFIENQKEVIQSFKHEKVIFAKEPCVDMLLTTLEENLGLLKERINNIVDGVDKG